VGQGKRLYNKKPEQLYLLLPVLYGFYKHLTGSLILHLREKAFWHQSVKLYPLYLFLWDFEHGRQQLQALPVFLQKSLFFYHLVFYMEQARQCRTALYY
jgi:hypothetical protein